MKRVINLKDNLSEESIQFLFSNFDIYDEKLSFVASNTNYNLVLNADGTASVYAGKDVLDFTSYQDAVDFIQI